MKNLFSKFAIIALLLGTSLYLTSCDDDDDNMDDTTPLSEKSVVEIAIEDENFSILVEALTKANLVSALEGTGPYTVFAPSNDAFSALFAELGVSGINELSAEALEPILLYHVINAQVKSSDISNGYVTTMNTATPDNMGSSLLVNIDNGVMLNNSSKVSTADIMGNNGIIHVIDQVILPPSVVDLAITNGNFSILVDALIKADLVNALSSEGPFTVFAPTNAAFETLFSDLGVTGIDDLTAEALAPILLYHVVGDNVNAAEVASGMVPTLNTDSDLNIKVSEMGVQINDASNVIVVDVQGSNGVIHVIDKVVLP
jgi:transforming growth factor-beta-induced protein